MVDDPITEGMAFILAGATFELLYFGVAPRVFPFLHQAIAYSWIDFLLWGIIIDGGIALANARQLVRRGIPFAGGAILVALLARDWYSVGVGFVGIFVIWYVSYTSKMSQIPG